MTTQRIHTCIYFDDGGAEHLCPCGSRAYLLVEEEGMDGVWVVFDDDAGDQPGELHELRRELAISA